MLNNVRTLCQTRGMARAYSLWAAHRVLGLTGPQLTLSKGAKIGAEWLNFSEYWSYWCNESQHGPTNAIPGHVRSFLRKCASRHNGGIAVDAGANVGVYSVELAALGYEVHAFEPIPETYARLQKNLALNSSIVGKVRSIDRALGDREQRLTMTGPGNSPATAHISQTPANGVSALLPVWITTLDAYAESTGIQHIDFLKLDVEGYEPAVLRGAARLLGRHGIDTVYFEWCPPLLRRLGFDPSEPLTELKNFGYAFYRIGSGGQLQEVSDSAILLEGCEWDNFVATYLKRQPS